MPDLTRTAARHVVVHGRVQGVFFRASTRRRAREAGVTGWVRNEADGSVEAWLEGSDDALDEVERWIREGGPPHAQVTRVEVAERDPEGHAEFTVRH